MYILGRGSIKGKEYLSELDFIRENTECNYILTHPGGGVWETCSQQTYPVLKDLVEHAHEVGLKVVIRLHPSQGFNNSGVVPQQGTAPEVDQAKVFHIPNPMESDAITQDYEMTADENGYAEFVHTAKWSRPKIAPLFCEVLRAYAFEKTGEGFYREETLTDITDCVRIYRMMPGTMEAEIDAGKEHAGKTIFVIVAQHYNYTETGEPAWQAFKRVLDSYADIPFDGVDLDEYGMSYLCLSSSDELPFRGRRYSGGMNEYYQNELKLDLSRLLFDMRYAPENKEEVRIKAINLYFDTLRRFPLYVENRVAEYAKKLFGEETYLGVHNTFHNKLDRDEIWSTACNWWDLPRDFGHTDENITFPVKMGVMLAAKEPIMMDMYYSKRAEDHYDHMIEGAPFGCREIHHSFKDFTWGQSFTEPEFLKKINKCDREIARLNEFQTEYPKLDLLIIFGASAQFNWYPNDEARNEWDVDGTLGILPKCDEMWKAGYRCALVPDYAVADGRIRLDGNKIYFNGHPFTHCLFLYPKYAKKETYALLNEAGQNGVGIAAVGRADIDFDGDAATLTIPCFEEFDLSILETINCPKSVIPGGCIYRDGSFSLMSHGVLTGEKTEFDFVIDGVRYAGHHTGLLAYRKGQYAFATEGSELWVDGSKEELTQ